MDPLEALSDSDLKHLSNNDLDSMSTEGLKILAADKSPAQQAQPAQAPPEDPWYTQLAHGAVDTLPTTGAIIGGMAGAELGPGAVGTAALGGAAGTAAKNAINSYFAPEQAPQSAGDALLSPVKGAVNGAMMEMGGQLAGKAVGALTEDAGQLLSSFGSKAEPAEQAVAPEVTDGLQAYIDKFKFKKDSIIEKQLTDLSERLKSTPPSEWSPKDIEAVRLRLGADSIPKDLSAMPAGSSPGILNRVADGARQAGDAIQKAGDMVPAFLGPKAYLLKKTAPKIASGIASAADATSKLLENPQVLGKYAPMLESAAQRGTEALAATHYVLQQRDPQYRQLVDQALGQTDSQNQGDSQ